MLKNKKSYIFVISDKYLESMRRFSCSLKVVQFKTMVALELLGFAGKNAMCD